MDTRWLAPSQVGQNSPLTIDVHCHLFNGSDVQLASFMNKTQSFSRALSNFVQAVDWTLAVNGEAEWAILQDLAQTHGSPIAGSTPTCNQGRGRRTYSAPLAPPHAMKTEAKQRIERARDDAYKRAKDSVTAAKTKLENRLQSREFSGTDTEDQDFRNDTMKALSAPDYQSFQKKAKKTRNTRASNTTTAQLFSATEMCGDPSSIAGDIETLIDYFLPRVVAAQNYLDTFCPSAGRGVDLMLAAMVDCDWWLAEGKPTLTSLTEQVKVMEQISILSGGRVHGLAPFCPLREVAHRAGKADPKTNQIPCSSLAFVQDAVTNRGCIGIKLYPPMGFAPYGNSELDGSQVCTPAILAPGCKCDSSIQSKPDFWKANDSLPPWVFGDIPYPADGSAAKLGMRLDQALDDLYTWCEKEGVPILAHTNQTNGIALKYAELATAKHWRKALCKYPKLRVNFGHMGGFDDSLCPMTAVPESAKEFMDLMGDGISPSTYAYAYADSAFDGVVLSYKDKFKQRLQAAYAQAPFASRFLYGTDWSLLVHLGSNSHYLKDFEGILKSLPTPSDGSNRTASERFFGRNAVEYIGLASAQCTRKRLETFYSKYCMDKPDWMLKVDAQST